MSSWNKRTVVGGLFVCAALTGVTHARADGITFGPNDVQTVFFVNKSDDKNRVDYGIRLDANCAPVNNDAMILYWRVFEKAPPIRLQGLSMLDRIPYGIDEQRIISRSDSGGEYALRLKSFNRPIGITTKKEADGKCSATARATINGTTAQLLSVFAKLAGFASVDYLDLNGKAFYTGAPVTERIKK